MQIVNNWLNFSLYRPGCWLCGQPAWRNAPVCRQCYHLLPHNRHRCQCCALPLPAGQKICGRCLRQPPHYQQSLIPFVYARPLDRLITGLKFRQQLAHARMLGELLNRHMSELSSMPDLLLPVPLHAKRLRQRGYNQALEIARFVARQHPLELAPELCHRIRHTDAQSDLPLIQRRRNLRNAFAVTTDLTGYRIAILDDVVTSGHTVNEMARCLGKAGADEITVIAVARADLPG